MDKRAIGVFDSGLGGLTAVRRLHALMPQENIIYFGDTGRVPYGTRGRDIITKYARQDVAFLRQFDLKSLIVSITCPNCLNFLLTLRSSARSSLPAAAP